MSAIDRGPGRKPRLSPPEAVKARPHFRHGAYEALCAEAENRLRGLLGPLAPGQLVDQAVPARWNESNAPFFKWFEDGELNASANCLDRTWARRSRTRRRSSSRPTTAQVTKVTYKELLARVSQFANALKRQGITRATASSSTCR